MKHHMIRLLVFTAAAVLLCSAVNAGESINVTDLAGRQVSLEAPAGRVISLSPAGCEFLNAMGGTDLLTARGETCDFPEEILSLPVVNPGMETDVSLIISMDPDLLLTGKNMLTEEQMAELDAAGICTVFCEAEDFDGIFSAVEMIGRLTGREQVAGYVKEGMLSTLEILEAAVEHREGGTETIYFETGGTNGSLQTAGGGTIPDMLAKMIGLENIFTDLEGISEVTEERVIELNPDHIAVIPFDNRTVPASEEEIKARPGWENIKAVQEDSVKVFEGFELVRPGPRLADGAALLYDFAFGEDDPSLAVY